MQKSDYVGSQVRFGNFDIARRVADGTAIEFNPLVGTSPRCECGDDLMGTTSNFRAEEQYDGWAETSNLLYQEQARVLFVN
jgi:hypothetical protein